jgi:hypothetical protein
MHPHQKPTQSDLPRGFNCTNYNNIANASWSCVHPAIRPNHVLHSTTSYGHIEAMCNTHLLSIDGQAVHDLGAQPPPHGKRSAASPACLTSPTCHTDRQSHRSPAPPRWRDPVRRPQPPHTPVDDIFAGCLVAQSFCRRRMPIASSAEHAASCGERKRAGPRACTE